MEKRIFLTSGEEKNDRGIVRKSKRGHTDGIHHAYAWASTVNEVNEGENVGCMCENGWKATEEVDTSLKVADESFRVSENRKFLTQSFLLLLLLQLSIYVYLLFFYLLYSTLFIFTLLFK